MQRKNVTIQKCSNNQSAEAIFLHDPEKGLFLPLLLLFPCVKD